MNTSNNNFDLLTKNIDKELKIYIYKNIFPEYSKNDIGHSLAHIQEVIVRSFQLNNSLKLNLDENLIFTIASCHDNGKYIDHENHNLIAAKLFYENSDFKKFFTERQRLIIKEAIEDHRSSNKDTPRSEYGKLISSADRNSSINTVFIRSFYVGKARTPNLTVEEFLDFTLDRLRKRYSKENPENMFYIDEKYKNFLNNMRNLLADEVAFKNEYCKVNNITNRSTILSNQEGIDYIYKAL